MSRLRPVGHFLLQQSSALRYLGANDRRVCILYTKDDHWATETSMNEIQALQDNELLPNSLSIHYNPQLTHAFVSHANETDLVVDYCVDQIKSNMPLCSKL